MTWCFSENFFLGLQWNSESYQAPKMELFAKIVKYKKPFTIFVKASILDIWQVPEYASDLPSKVTDLSIFLLNQFEYQR